MKALLEKAAFGEAKNVLLTDGEILKLHDRFGMEYRDRIEALSLAKAAHGYRYKSDFHALLAWARKDERRAIRASGFIEKPDPPSPDFLHRKASAIHTMFRRDFERGLRANLPTFEQVLEKVSAGEV